MRERQKRERNERERKRERERKEREGIFGVTNRACCGHDCAEKERRGGAKQPNGARRGWK